MIQVFALPPREDCSILVSLEFRKGMCELNAEWACEEWACRVVRLWDWLHVTHTLTSCPQTTWKWHFPAPGGWGWWMYPLWSALPLSLQYWPSLSQPGPPNSAPVEQQYDTQTTVGLTTGLWLTNAATFTIPSSLPSCSSSVWQGRLSMLRVKIVCDRELRSLSWVSPTLRYSIVCRQGTCYANYFFLNWTDLPWRPGLNAFTDLRWPYCRSIPISCGVWTVRSVIPRTLTLCWCRA